MIHYPTADDAYILGMINQQTSLDHGTRGEINSAVRGYANITARQVLGFVNTGTKVYEARVADEDILRLDALPVDDRHAVCEVWTIVLKGISQDMKIMVAVAIKLDG